MNRVELRARRSKLRSLVLSLSAAQPSLSFSRSGCRVSLAEGEGETDRRGPAELYGGRGGSQETRRVNGRALPCGHSSESVA